jgi:hypothetical protein
MHPQGGFPSHGGQFTPPQQQPPGSATWHPQGAAFQGTHHHHHHIPGPAYPAPMHGGHAAPRAAAPLQPIALQHPHQNPPTAQLHMPPNMGPAPFVSTQVRVDARRNAFVVLGGRRGQTGEICQRVADDPVLGNQIRYIRATTPDSDGVTPPLAHPLVLLERQIQENAGKPPSHIIVDDCLVSSVFEAYYCEDILKKNHLRVDSVFYLDYTLEKMNAEDPLDHHADRIYHPLGFEAGSWYDGAGQGWLKKIVPYDAAGNDKSVEEIAKEIAFEVKRSIDDPAKKTKKDAELPPSTAIKGMTIVRDFSLVCALRLAVQPYVDDYFNAPSPQLLMEYSYFTRFAHQLRSYMITHALTGVRGCLVGYQSAVYFLVSGCVTLMKVDPACLPSPLQRHLSAPGSDSAVSASSSELSFVLDATCSASETSGRHVIHVSDMLLLKGHTSDSLIWQERHELLAREFAGVDHSGSLSHPASPKQPSSPGGSPSVASASTNYAPLTVALQQYWRPDDIDSMMARSLPHSGFIFAGPGTLPPRATFAPTNYFWPKPDAKKVELRIWNARLVTETDPFLTKAQGPTVLWLFDAYMLGADGGEVKCDYPVYISEEDVAKDTINDGNILELVKETIAVPVATPAGLSAVKGKAPAPKVGAVNAQKVAERTVLRYVRRKTFSVFPMSSVFVSGIWEPKWSLEGLVRATRNLTFLQRSRRRDDIGDRDADEDRD